MKDEKLLFLGGFFGTGKTFGKPFYALTLGKISDRETCFGYDMATVFVDKDVFDDFQKSAPDGAVWIHGCLVYCRGGYVLVSYSFK